MQGIFLSHFAPPMSSHEHGVPPSYDAHDSLSIRPVSELPIYTLQEGGVAAPPAVPMADLPSPSIPRDATSSLAGASLRPDPKEYTYEIRNYRSKPWAILTLLADPRLSRTTPTFLEGSNIAGSVKLSLSSRDRIESVVIFVSRSKTECS